jgi:ssDNA-binding replication factor A large subunit
MTDDDDRIDDERIKARAEALLPEEEEAGSDDPVAQAAAILEESDEREFERDDPTGEGLEHRHSEDTVDLPDLSDAAGPEDD